LFSHALRTLGAAALKKHLASIRLKDFVPDVPEEFLGLTALDALDHLWDLTARPEQLPPSGNWQTWIIMAGRGAGKTRAGAQTTVAAAQEAS
jgi:hypothetical protein